MELERDMEEAQTVNLSVSMTVDSAAVLSAIAKRFDVTRLSLTSPALESIAGELFDSLNDADMEKVAEIADEIATEMLIKQGVTIHANSIDGEGTGKSAHWRSIVQAKKRYAAKQGEEK